MVDIRDQLAVLMRATIADQQAHHTWVYREVRPMPVPPSWHSGQFVQGDCSKGVQYLCKWAGAPDPMGDNFNSYGNSATIWVNNHHLAAKSELVVGDFVTFGYNGSQHAAMVMQAGVDPVVWSFGHQGAPNSYRLSQDPRPQQYLRNPVAIIVTPQDKLRAETGWFSWVAWRLGEGDWKKYGKANPDVRPNVPRLIPPSWWKQYADFLRDRNKGG